jgi:hypothetical protein
MSKLTEICPVAAALIHAEKYAKMKNLIGTFRDYANAPKDSARIFQDWEL